MSVEISVLVDLGESQPRVFLSFFSDFASSNKLLFFTPEGSSIELIDLNEEPVSHRLELPMQIKSLHPLSEHQAIYFTKPLKNVLKFLTDDHFQKIKRN